MPPSAVRDSRVTFRAFLLVGGVLSIVLGVSIFFSNRGIAELQQARKRVAELQADITRLQAENARLKNEIDSVKKSSYAVERIAREELGMSKKGEVIYVLPKKQ
ncbi:MAG TPA: septum formation initiator family protein [Thermoanaerobaculia bacterium]